VALTAGKKAFYAPFDWYNPTAMYGHDDKTLDWTRSRYCKRKKS